MKTLGLRTKLFLLSVVLLVIAGVCAFAYLRVVADRTLLSEIRGDLLVRLDLVERTASSSKLPLAPSPEWDALADDLGRRANARVTIFDARQRMLGDSRLSYAEVSQNPPDDRPEVRDALAGQRGQATRYSAVLKQEVTYAAAPIVHGDEIVGAVRLALPSKDLEATRHALEDGLLAACVIGVLLAIVMSTVAGHLALQGVRELTLAARRMAGGDLEVRTRAEGQDEIADLGRSLEQLADGLRSSLKELVGERDVLSGILTSMREGVLLVDRDGLVALINPALREMLFLGDDDVGKAPKDVIDDEGLHGLVDQARTKSEGAQGEIEVEGIKPRRLLVRAEPLPVEPGGVVVVFHDVTDLRRLETLRRDFVANASHELRTPVTSIRSAAETLAGMPPSDAEAQKRFLGIIERNAERLQRLVEDLLDLSKIESRELKLHREPVDLRMTAERVVSLLTDRAARAKTTLHVAIPADHPMAHADSRALEQILENLLENSLKYCPNASVTVRAEADEHDVVLVVEDTGPGIEKRHLERLFERFYRVDTGRSRQLGGTGLGLAIVKHLAEAMGGSVKVESTVGKGTRFTVRLPAFAVSDDDLTPTSLPDPVAQGRSAAEASP
jgi:two-component system phosphate regulon sensor histidine kinase PhoR